ncbi:hypothetical protein JCM8097_006944 [Rhodosporidiobolus ruineniae]
MSVDFSPPVLKHSGRLELTVDFKANLLDDKLSGTFQLPDVPLPGKWSVELTSGTAAVEIDFHHIGAKYAVFGERVSTSVEIFWIGGSSPSVLHRTSWHSHAAVPHKDPKGDVYAGMSATMPPEKLRNFAKEAKHVFNPSELQPYRLVFRLEQSSPLFEAGAPVSQGLAARSSNLDLNLVPHDVRLFFPSTQHDGLELWTTSHLLSASSDYYADLFKSGFSETTPRRSKRTRKSGETEGTYTVPTVDKDFDDSDDEADKVFLGGKQPKHSELPETPDFSFRQITVNQAAFSTYRAFLVYHQTGYLCFAPLRSTSSPQNPSSSMTRHAFLLNAKMQSPMLPLPVSPKSLYRLAHFLRLRADNPLTSACLEAFSSALSIQGAADELFSDASVSYDELRRIAVDYVVKNWEAVNATASWKDKMEAVKRNEVHEFGTAMVELMMAREEAMKSKA